MARLTAKDRLKKYATGGEEPILSEQEKYYQASAKLAYYKDQLNKQLKGKNPQGYTDFFKGLVDLRRKGDQPGASKYVQDSAWNDYLTPKEVKTSLGDKYQDYLDSLQAVNTYDVKQGKQPLYGTVEGENDVTKLNYGRRFASLAVTPSYSSYNKTRNTSYNRNYTYNPQTGAVDYTEEGDLNLRPSYLSAPKMAAGGVAGGGGTPSPKKAPTKFNRAAMKKKYAANPYLIGGGQNRYYWASMLDREFPLTGGTVREGLYGAARANQIDPALLYGSAMEEGMSGAIDDKNYENASEAYVQWSEKNPKAAEQFPVDTFYNYGLDQFAGNMGAMIKKGYLPKDFGKNFKTFDIENEKGEKGKGSAFNTDANALLAKSAMLRMAQDQLDSYTTKTGTTLTPKQKEFFLLANYNGGEGNMRKMMDSYKSKGYLKDDKFLAPSFKPEGYGGIYKNVMARMQVADMLRNEGFISDFATGGEVEGLEGLAGAGGGGAMGAGGWGAAGQLLPVLGDALQALFTKPQKPSDQPIMNAQTAKTMTSPYAFGGELDDIDEEQYMEWLRSMFVNQLSSEVSAEEPDADDLAVGVGEEDDMDGDEEDSFAMGGKAGKKHWIQKAVNPKHKGYCTPMTKSTCTPKRKALARTFKKHHGFHAYGGPAYAGGGMTDIEVEGDEVVQTPDGQMKRMQGPSHEQGGIDMTVPAGTKIYSDRLQIEGKTMQQRKLSREKRLKLAAKNFESKKYDQLARNTFERTKEIVDAEEAQDMQLQKIANKIYSPPQQAAYGDEVGDPWSDYINSLMPTSIATKVPYMPGADTSQLPSAGNPLSGSMTGRGINVNAPVAARTAEDIGLQTPAAGSQFNIPEIPGEEPEYSNVGGFTTGDYIGMGANLFNAIAPIINTRNAAKATKPEINRFKGFGRQALEANAKAQGFAGVQFNNAKRDLDTATNSAVLRNRMGARNINTSRALDIVTDINRNKAAANLYGQYTDKLSGLLGQEGQLANQRDQMEMAGATARDEREAQNTDNYYSNMAENLVNLGTNVGNIGAQLNKSKANKDNAELLAQMSEYFDFGRDKSGKLVLKNKKR